MRRNSIACVLILGLVLGSLSLPTAAAPARTADSLAARAESFFGHALQAARTWLTGFFLERQPRGEVPSLGTEHAVKTHPVSNSSAERRIVPREGCVLDPFGKPCSG